MYIIYICNMVCNILYGIHTIEIDCISLTLDLTSFRQRIKYH